MSSVTVLHKFHLGDILIYNLLYTIGATPVYEQDLHLALVLSRSDLFSFTQIIVHEVEKEFTLLDATKTCLKSDTPTGI